MKAARIHAKGEEYKLDEVDVPVVERDNEVVFQVRAAGLCHTDFMVRDGAFGENYPITGSHENVGVVTAVGAKAVKADGSPWRKGDRIGTLAFQNPCGECPDCTSDEPGYSVYCENMSGMGGVTTHGGFAGYMRCDANFSVSIPEEIDWAQAAPLMCAGATIYAAIKRCKLPKGSAIAIIGLGGLGHLGVQFAKAAGYHVIAVDARQEPLDLVQSQDFKPDTLCDVRKWKDGNKAREELLGVCGTTKWPGADATIVATDNNDAFLYGADITRKHGTLVVVGQPEKPAPITYHSAIFRDIRVIGSLLSDRKTAQEMVDLVAEKKMKVSVKEYPLEDVNKMVEDFHKPGMKGRFVVKQEA